MTPKATNREEFLEEARSGAFDGVKACYRTFGSVSITGRIEGEVCEVLGEKGLRFLCHNGECPESWGCMRGREMRAVRGVENRGGSVDCVWSCCDTRSYASRCV